MTEKDPSKSVRRRPWVRYERERERERERENIVFLQSIWTGICVLILSPRFVLSWMMQAE